MTESHADIRPVNRAASNLNAQIVNGSIQRVGSRERCIPVVVFDRATVESVNPTQKRYYSGTRVEASSPPTPASPAAAQPPSVVGPAQLILVSSALLCVGARRGASLQSGPPLWFARR